MENIPFALRLSFQILYVITALGIVFVVISENRNPLKTISWVLLLLLFPIGGIVVYYFFGQDNRKHRIISRKIYKRIKTIPVKIFSFEEKNSVPEIYKPLVQLLNKNDAATLLSGNVEIFITGKKKFACLIKDLEEAQNHIHLQYYIFSNDHIGHQIKEILIKKAKEGVKVRVLYDDVGNWREKKSFYEEMNENGIEVHNYLKVRFPLLTSRVNYRNHRKIVVIDGHIGYMGGMNIADRYINGPSWNAIWRDTHIRVTGSAVYGMQSTFLIDWYTASQNLITDPIYFPKLEGGKSLMQIAVGGPIGEWRTLLQATIRAIAGASKSIYIQTPYFLPTEGICQALQSAALGGLDVRLMIPERCDTHFIGGASRSYLEEMMRSGVRIYFYTEGFLHAKLLLIDDYLTVIGSANMDFRSFEHNFEANAYIYDTEVAKQMKKIFYKDQQSSHRISLKIWQKRSQIEKFKESVLRLFSPLL